MKSKILLIIVVLLALGAGFYFYQVKGGGAGDYKSASFLIDGERVKIDDQVTKYFGNEVRADLNGDGLEDRAFIITRSPGGSGTFYYAVAAVNTGAGYVGSDGYLLGDRIAPQSTNLSSNPRHKKVAVFNYADRAPAEPMITPPSIGKSLYLKLDQNNRWGIVDPNFSESNQINKQFNYTCPSGQAFKVGLAGTSGQSVAVLSLTSGESYTLKQTISASGVRYANNDESLVLWTKGAGAFIEQNGTTTYQDCVTHDPF